MAGHSRVLPGIEVDLQDDVTACRQEQVSPIGRADAIHVVRASLDDLFEPADLRPVFADDAQADELDTALDEMHVQVLVATLRGKGEAPRDKVAAALARLGKQGADALVRGLESADPVTRLRSIVALRDAAERPAHAVPRLIARIEELCHERGVRTLRLDTRSVLSEACALYERLGFERVTPFNESPYSDRWYAKALRRD